MTPLPPLAGLRAAVEAAGAVALAWFGKAAVTTKSDGTPLTQADLASNEVLRRELGRLLPGAGWLSEETPDGDERLGRELAWVVDPLDGTKEFSAGVPQFAVSVGLVRDGAPVGGAVFNPATGEGGAAMNGRAEFWGFGALPPPAKTLAQAHASISRTELSDGRLKDALPALGLASCEAVGGVSYKLLRAAAGREHLTFAVQPRSEWDVCGGAALLAAAGKVYRRLDGEPVVFNRRDTRIRSGAAGGDPALVAGLIEVLDSLQPCS
jgi:myo-inositol-1(or 4)-monophosphatase